MQGWEDLNLKKIIRKSGLRLKDFGSACELTAKETMLWWSGQGQNLRTRHIENFENYFGLSFESLVEDTESIKLLRKRMFGDFDTLPEKYRIGANSYARSSYYIVKYLEFLHGKHYVDQFLSSLSIHPRFFEDLDRKINISFINDLLMHCNSIGFEHDDFKKLAQSLFLSVRNTEIEKDFSSSQTHRELFEYFATHISRFDQNFTYDFIISKNSLELITRINPEVKDNLLSKGHSIEKVFYYRPIIIEQLPKIAGFTPLDVSIKACFSRGDQFSRFQAHFPKTSLRVLDL